MVGQTHRAARRSGRKMIAQAGVPGEPGFGSLGWRTRALGLSGKRFKPAKRAAEFRNNHFSGGKDAPKNSREATVAPSPEAHCDHCSRGYHSLAAWAAYPLVSLRNE